ncbi:hypothetical protein Pint_26091 [Pistacia integerrima]|uniref:Uncharacterized protein n=1 Tax=Pistacia integerrima TaxID=434235 RepID=A0ACC0YER7_9ROSI|nr:hypothetical protein Pint_26091 [Pistacia integerrima]
MDAREHVKHRMKFYRRNGEMIFEDVLKWMTNVKELVDDNETFGSRDVLEHIYDSILDHPDVNMIEVYGIGGIGKTV